MALLALIYYRAHIPTLPHEQRFFAWVGINFVLLFCVPSLVIKFAFKRRLSEFGLQWGDARLWGKYFLGFMLVVLPAVLISARFQSFQGYYSYHQWAAQSVGAFLLFAAGWLVYFFAWEFFFRGFMLFGLAPSLGTFAIFVQMVPFAMMHFNKPEMESYAAIVAGIALGVMAYRSKSCVGCWLLHWVIAVLMYAVVLLPR